MPAAETTVAYAAPPAATTEKTASSGFEAKHRVHQHIYFLVWIQQSHRSVPLLYEAMSASTQLPAFGTVRLLVEAAVAEESTEN